MHGSSYTFIVPLSSDAIRKQSKELMGNIVQLIVQLIMQGEITVMTEFSSVFKSLKSASFIRVKMEINAK